MFSQAVEYALRAVIQLADHSPSPRTTDQIAAATLVCKRRSKRHFGDTKGRDESLLTSPNSWPILFALQPSIDQLPNNVLAHPVEVSAIVIGVGASVAQHNDCYGGIFAE